MLQFLFCAGVTIFIAYILIHNEDNKLEKQMKAEQEIEKRYYEDCRRRRERDGEEIINQAFNHIKK